MSLPGPDIKNGIIRKIKSVSQQVQKANLQFLDTKLFSRLVAINVANLPDIPDPEAKQNPSPDSVQPVPQQLSNDNTNEKKCPEDGLVSPEEPANNTGDDSKPTKEPPPPLLELPDVPGSPFRRYSLFMFNTFEANSRYRQTLISHSDLVHGDEGMDDEDSWVTYFANRFRDDHYCTSSILRRYLANILPALKIEPEIIDCQVAFLKLAPPTRIVKIHMASEDDPPFLDWITKTEAFKAFKAGIGPQIFYMHGVTRDSQRLALISQYLYTRFEYDSLLDVWWDDYGGSVFYFEFDKHDSRYNNIKGMLITFITEMTWRHCSKVRDMAPIARVFKCLRYYPSLSLQSLFKLFIDVWRC